MDYFEPYDRLEWGGGGKEITSEPTKTPQRAKQRLFSDKLGRVVGTQIPFVRDQSPE